MYRYPGSEPTTMRTWRRPKQRLKSEVYMKPISPAGLKARREREGFTQRDLAALCKCSQAAISALECGTMKQCSEDLAQQISKWLRRDMDELFIRRAQSPMPIVTTAASRGSQLTTA